MPGEMKAYAILMTEEMMIQFQGVAHKKKDAIEKLIKTNIPKWKQWVMNKVFNYGIKSENKPPKQGEMIREQIILTQGTTELDKIVFIVKEGEGPDLRSMIPREAFQDNEKPNYIG